MIVNNRQIDKKKKNQKINTDKKHYFKLHVENYGSSLKVELKIHVLSIER